MWRRKEKQKHLSFVRSFGVVVVVVDNTVDNGSTVPATDKNSVWMRCGVFTLVSFGFSKEETTFVLSPVLTHSGFFFIYLCVAPFRYDKTKINSIRRRFHFDSPEEKIYSFFLPSLYFTFDFFFIFFCLCCVYLSRLCIRAKIVYSFLESVLYHYRFVFP